MPLSLPPPELAGAGNRSGLISSADHAAILLPKSANFDDVILVSNASPSTCADSRVMSALQRIVRRISSAKR
jgi:hypothetical protein